MTRRVPLAAIICDAALEASVIGSFSRLGFAARARMFGWDTAETDRLTARRILITGANSGLGFAATVALLSGGATVVATTRSAANSEQLQARVTALLGDSVAARLITDEVDLDDLTAVQAFATRHAAGALDTLIHNAGALSHTYGQTVDGFERTVQAHVLAPFLLTTLLRPTLERCAPARVITVTSGGLYTAKLNPELFNRSSEGFNGTRMYGEAKRAQLVLTNEWQRRFGSDNLSFYATHPGWVNTPGLARSLPGFSRLLGPLLRTPAMGIDTILYLTTHTPAVVRNRVWHDRRPRGQHRLPTTFHRRGRAGQLWADACRATGVNPYT